MCGRYSISVTRDEMKKYLDEYYDIKVLDEKIVLPRYNMAPSQDAISIINDGTKYRIGLLKWGFIPEFAKDEKTAYKMINARSETIDEKSFFKKPFMHQRCIILADGFFEWERTGSQKTPLRFTVKNKKIFGFAGLYSRFKREDGETVFTCVIITTKANTLIADIHDRMPVILDEDKAKIWLDPDTRDFEALKSILLPYDPDEMELAQVSSHVNNVQNDDPECVRKIKTKKIALE